MNQEHADRHIGFLHCTNGFLERRKEKYTTLMAIMIISSQFLQIYLKRLFSHKFACSRQPVAFFSVWNFVSVWFSLDDDDDDGADDEKQFSHEFFFYFPLDFMNSTL